MLELKFGKPQAAVITATELGHRVKQLQTDLAKAPPPAAAETFGEKLKLAVQRRVGNRARVSIRATASASDGNDFARKLSEATKRLAEKRQNRVKENAAKERARYHKPVRRPPSRSD